MSYNAAYHRKYNQEHKEKKNEYHKKWVLEHKDSQRVKRRKYYASLPKEEKVRRGRNNNLKSSYGMTVEQYDRMYSMQDGRCVCCAVFCERLHVDHDHQTGKIRGLLCQPCNTALGLVQDDILVLRAMIEYLEKSNG